LFFFGGAGQIDGHKFVVSRWSLAVRRVVLSQRLTTIDEQLLQFLNRYRIIRIDAHLACNLHRFFGNLAGGEFSMSG
jgi:hypothetical protein